MVTSEYLRSVHIINNFRSVHNFTVKRKSKEIQTCISNVYYCGDFTLFVLHLMHFYIINNVHYKNWDKIMNYADGFMRTGILEDAKNINCILCRGNM